MSKFLNAGKKVFSIVVGTKDVGSRSGMMFYNRYNPDSCKCNGGVVRGEGTDCELDALDQEVC